LRKLRLLPIIVSALILAGAAVGLGQPQTTSAAPVGAAQNVTPYSHSCLDNGSVLTRFAWSPSGWGTQWFDISAVNNGFAHSFLNAGPLAPTANQLDWYQLVTNTRYYVRVNTFTNIGWLPSDTITFVTPSCGSFTPPSNPQSQVLDSDSVRFTWDRGQNNEWFCLDMALSQGDLVNFGPTFSNWGCGMTGESYTAHGLACGLKHYWRVYGAGAYGSGYTPIREFTPGNCAFSPPTDPNATVINSNTVKFEWESGTNNIFFCVDTAENEEDLKGIKGTFMNHGCGVTAETFTSSVVPCGKQQVFRIWAVGPGTNGYSPIGSFTTGVCPITAPTNLDADTIDADTVHFEWTKGVDNITHCLDWAESENDLNTLSGTFENACNISGSEYTLDSLDCNTTYYWRVFARGTGGSAATSVVETAKTAQCAT